MTFGIDEIDQSQAGRKLPKMMKHTKLKTIGSRSQKINW
jgi:hypothetical protein